MTPIVRVAQKWLVQLRLSCLTKPRTRDLVSHWGAQPQQHVLELNLLVLASTYNADYSVYICRSMLCCLQLSNSLVNDKV
jgi:hypothetical protein